MIPIRDNIRSQNYPVVNYFIIALCVIAYFWELSLGAHTEWAFMSYGIVPVKYSNPMISSGLGLFEKALPFLTSMFLHGGFFHILGNMWFLYIFGDNVEDRLGHARYLFFYILSGIAAGMIHLFTNWHSQVPTIGASGAIAGVMGAYFLLYPRARVLTTRCGPVVSRYQLEVLKSCGRMKKSDIRRTAPLLSLIMAISISILV